MTNTAHLCCQFPNIARLKPSKFMSCLQGPVRSSTDDTNCQPTAFSRHTGCAEKRSRSDRCLRTQLMACTPCQVGIPDFDSRKGRTPDIFASTSCLHSAATRNLPDIVRQNLAHRAGMACESRLWLGYQLANADDQMLDISTSSSHTNRTLHPVSRRNIPILSLKANGRDLGFFRLKFLLRRQQRQRQKDRQREAETDQKIKGHLR